MKKTIIALSFLGTIFTYAQEKANNPVKENQIEGVTITKTK